MNNPAQNNKINSILTHTHNLTKCCCQANELTCELVIFFFSYWINIHQENKHSIPLCVTNLIFHLTVRTKTDCTGLSWHKIIMSFGSRGDDNREKLLSSAESTLNNYWNFASISLQQKTRREPKTNKNQQWSLQETNSQSYDSSRLLW